MRLNPGGQSHSKRGLAGHWIGICSPELPEGQAATVQVKKQKGASRKAGATGGILSAMRRMETTRDRDFTTTIVSVEEPMRGWLALIHRGRDALEQVRCYLEMETLLRFFQKWRGLSFDRRAAFKFDEFQQQRIRIGTQDLTIAAIAVVEDALLL